MADSSSVTANIITTAQDSTGSTVISAVLSNQTTSSVATVNLAAGAIGLTGPAGAPGSSGTGVPDGGNIGQILSRTGTTTTGWIDAPSSTGISRLITQPGHGFIPGRVLEFINNSYVLARADGITNAEVVGIVASVPDVNHFFLVTEGYLSGLTGLTAGSVHFLNPSTAGSLTTIEPSLAGQVSKPLMVADTATSGYFHNYRGIAIGTTSGSASTTTTTPPPTTTTTSSVLSVRTVTASTTLSSTDDILYVTNSNLTITLPSAINATSKRFTIKNGGPPGSFVNFVTQTGQTVDGVASGKFYDVSMDLVTTGSNWIII